MIDLVKTFWRSWSPLVSVDNNEDKGEWSVAERTTFTEYLWNKGS